MEAKTGAVKQVFRGAAGQVFRGAPAGGATDRQARQQEYRRFRADFRSRRTAVVGGSRGSAQEYGGAQGGDTGKQGAPPQALSGDRAEELRIQLSRRRDEPPLSGCCRDS